MWFYDLVSPVANLLPLGTQKAEALLPKTRSLSVPNLFAGILSGEPTRNPHEAVVGPESEAWTKEYVQWLTT